MIRRSSASLLAVPTVAIALYALFSRGTPWRGEWSWTMDWATGATIFICPLVAGAAAFDTASWHETSVKLLDSTGRSKLARLAPATWAALTGAVAFAVTVIVAAGLTLSAGAKPDLDVRILALALLAIGTASLVGSAVAWLWPSMLSAPVAAIAIFVLALAAATTSVPPLFRFGGSTGTLVGLTLNPSFFWLVGAGLALVAVAVAAWIVRPSGAHRVTALCLSALAVVAVGGLWIEQPERIVQSSSNVSMTCEGKGPRVCLASQTSRLLDRLPEQLHERSSLLASVGITPPAKFTQVVPGHPVTQGAPLFLESSEINKTQLAGQFVDSAMARPASCRADTGNTPPPDAVFSARSTISAWLALQMGGLTAADFAGRSDEAWLKLPVAKQLPWLRSTYKLLASCDFADVTDAPS